MVQAEEHDDAMAGSINAEPLPPSDPDKFQWTHNLVQSVDKRLRDAVNADELKKLTLENAKPEFKKVLQQFVCPICTNILEDYTCCSDCEGLICRSCLN